MAVFFIDINENKSIVIYINKGDVYMAMNFEEVKSIVLGNSLGYDFVGGDDGKDFLIEDDGVLTGREQLMFLVNELVENYDDTKSTKLTNHNDTREILIKFANSKNAMRRDMTVEQIVDEFLESN